jgi:hypothetical protein
VSACPEYQLLKRDYESALREEALYQSGGAASPTQAMRYVGEAKAASVAAGDHLMAHRNSCSVCSCVDQIRLAQEFADSNRAWLVCRARNPIDLRDEAEIFRLNQANLDALTSRSAAAGRLYEHRIRCPICKNSRLVRP